MQSLFQAFANVADGVLIVNQDQQIIYWNQAAEKILGYRQNEVVDRPCYEILNGCDNQGWLVCRQYCHPVITGLNGGSVPNYDFCIRTKLGQTRWINMSTFTFSVNETKTDAVLVHLFRDVTQNKQSEQFMEHVLTAAKQLHNGEFSQPVRSVSIEQQYNNLTDREQEVLALLAQGYSTNDIARSLSISPATTRNHIRNILQKLHVHSRLEAVVYAQDHGLITKD